MCASGGVIRRSDHLHLLPVVGEFFSTIQAHDVRVTSRPLVGTTGLTGLDSDWKRTVLVRTAEQRIDEPRHLSPFRRISGDLLVRGLTYKFSGSLRLTSCRYVHHFLAGTYLRVQEVIMLGTALLPSAAFASLFVLSQFNFSLERFVARRFTRVLSGRSGWLVHDCSF